MKKIVYVDMDNVLVDFPSGIAKLDPSTQQKFADDLDEVPGIFSLMEPMEGAITSFNSLKEVRHLYPLDRAVGESLGMERQTALGKAVSWRIGS